MSRESLSERIPAFAQSGKILKENDNKEQKPDNTLNSSGKLSHFRIKRLSDITAQAVEWLWNPFIALSAFTILEGAEGEGKTFLTLALATAVAGGNALPFTSERENIEPSNVLLMSAEDSLAHTIKPRLESMNAACERIFAIDEPFTLDQNGIAHLEKNLADYQPKLIIIDPLFSYTGKINLDRDNEIRSVTSELIRISEDFECAIIGIRHIGKSKGNGDPRNAGLNGIGWRASARSVLLVGKNPDNDCEKALVQTKNNLAEKSSKAVGFEIRDGRFFWTGESQLTAEKMLSQAKSENERSEQSEAASFLLDALSNGERLATEVEKEADELFGLSKKQLRTAREKIGVIWQRKGFGKDSEIYLSLPSIDAQITIQRGIDSYTNEEGHL